MTHTPAPLFDICVLRHLSSDLNSMAFNFVRSWWNCWIFLFFFLSLAMRQSIKWGYDSQSVTNKQNALRPVGQTIETKEKPIERKTAKCYSNIVQIHKCRMLKSEQRGGGRGERTECAVCRHTHTHFACIMSMCFHHMKIRLVRRRPWCWQQRGTNEKTYEYTCDIAAKCLCFFFLLCLCSI